MSRSHRRTGGRPPSKRPLRRTPDPWFRGASAEPQRKVDAEGAHALFLRGREEEKADNPAGALHLYRLALAASDVEWLPADTGMTLYHMGDCFSLLGDERSSWDAYLVAARTFHEHCKGLDVGSSLGKAGLLLVDFRPPVPIRDEVSHALLLAGVVDALDQAVSVMLGEALPKMGNAQVVHRKLTGLMVLAGAAAANVILTTGASAIYHRIAIPFAERADVRGTGVNDGPRFVACAFADLARIYEAVGVQEHPERVGVPATPDEVRSLARLTAIAFAGAPRELMARWLGAYLRDRRGATWATDEVIEAIQHER